MSAMIIAGATRGVGLEVARLERTFGRMVIALVRPGSDAGVLRRLGVDIVWGDALSALDVASLFRGTEGRCDIVSTLGGRADDGRRADDLGNANLVDAAVQASLSGRFLLVTSIGCGEMAPFTSSSSTAAVGADLEAKTRAEDRLRNSGLKWTILRPGGLNSRPATGEGMLSADPETHGSIGRADLAQLVVRALRDPTTARRVFAAVDISQSRCANPISPHRLRPMVRVSSTMRH